MDEITLTQDQKKLIEELNNFINSGKTNCLITNKGNFFGISIALLYFIKNFQGNVIIFTLTKRPAKSLFEDYFKLLNQTENIIYTNNESIIEYIDDKNLKRRLEFTIYTTFRFVDYQSLLIYTQGLYDKFELDSNILCSKKIGILNKDEFKFFIEK